MIETVLGLKNIDGIILPHEHLLIDLKMFAESGLDERLSLSNRYKIWSDPYVLKDNAVIDSEEVLLRELSLFKSAGGDTIVDVTLDEIGRNPTALKRLSEKSGVNIVMGCGRYVNPITRQSKSEIAQQITNDLTIGIDGIKAGVIGEIGTSATITENEWLSVQGAGIAAKQTGKAIQVHTSLWEENGLTVIDELIKMGVKPKQISINHIDVDLRLDYLLKLLDKGAYIEFDNFGKEYFIPKRENGTLKGRFAYDLERCQIVKKLLDLGYERQILISNDICLKSLLCEYGGNGYAHMINNIMPMLKECGVNQKQIDILYRENPKDFLECD